MTSRLLAPRFVAAAALAVALPIVAGCGAGKGDISGKVKYKGEVLPGGSVQFMTPGGAFTSEIASDGSYSISGAATGPAKISITYQDPRYVEYMNALVISARDPSKPKPKGNPDDFNKVPTKYTDPNTSGLTYEVKSGSQSYDIELK